MNITPISEYIEDRYENGGITRRYLAYPKYFRDDVDYLEHQWGKDNHGWFKF